MERPYHTLLNKAPDVKMKLYVCLTSVNISSFGFSLPENEVSARGVSGNQLTASSEKRYRQSSWPYNWISYKPSYGRLGYTGGTGGWMPVTNNIGSEYLEVGHHKKKRKKNRKVVLTRDSPVPFLFCSINFLLLCTRIWYSQAFM